MGGSRSLTLPVVAAPLGVCMKAPPTAAVRRLLHPSVCVPGQGSWPIQPISCPGKAARALRHVRYTPSSRSRGPKISDPPTSPPPLGPLLPASTGFVSWPIPYFSGLDSTGFLLHLIFPLPFRHRACLAFSPCYQVSSCLSSRPSSCSRPQTSSAVCKVFRGRCPAPNRLYLAW